MPVRRTIDLNADLGEGYGPWRMGDDAALLGLVTSASVACGFHAGDPTTMAETFALAAARGVAVGAHPGFDDKPGFGRRVIPCTEAEVERLVAYQVGAAAAVAALAGTRITYVKAHGALHNLAQSDAGTARAVARAINAVDATLMHLVMPGTAAERASRDLGLGVALEVFADRGYRDDLTLAPRGTPGALLADAEEIARTVVAMVEEGAVRTLSGRRVPVAFDSVCLHGDSPSAVVSARRVRESLEAAGVGLAPFAPTPGP